MIKLTDFDKKFIEGKCQTILENEDGSFETALECFEAALKLKDDPRVYLEIGRVYFLRKEYRTAQEYFLKAIDKGFDAYHYFADVTAFHLMELDEAVEFLEKAAERHDSNACFELAKLCLSLDAGYKYRDPSLASKYLELAYEYCSEEEKVLMAYQIAKKYNMISVLFPNDKINQENREYHYLKIFSKHYCTFYRPEHSNIFLFDAYDKNDDYEIMDVLYDSTDGNAFFIFALLLLEEEYLKTNTINIGNSAGLLAAAAGSSKYNHSGCAMLLSLAVGSDFEGSENNPDQVNRLIKVAKRKKFFAPQRFKQFMEDLMEHLLDEYKDDSSVNA